MARPPLKGLILAGGARATGARSFADAGAPELLPVANKPLLHYALDIMREHAVHDVAVVVSSTTLDPVAEAAEDGERWGLRIRYFEAERRPGVVPALAAVADFLEGSACLAHTGTGVLEANLGPAIEATADGAADVVLLLHRPGDGGGRAGRFGGPQGTEPAGVHLLGPRVAAQARALAPASGEPVRLGDALDALVSAGGRVCAWELAGAWYPVEGSDELLAANRAVLERLEPGEAGGAELVDTQIQGAVAIDPSARLESTVVRGPVAIGARAEVRHSYIGPYSAIGSDVLMEGAEIEDSVVLPGASILHLDTRLESSIVGRGAKLARSFALPRALRVRIGAGDEISFG